MRDIQEQIESKLKSAGLTESEIRSFNSMYAGRKITPSIYVDVEAFIHSTTLRRQENSMSSTIPHQIAPSNAYHSASDEAGRCPHCYTSGNQVHLGQVTIDNVDRPVYHCKSCNKGYTELPSVIKIIAEEAVRQGATQVGFIPANVRVEPSSIAQSQTAAHSYQIDQTNQKLDAVSSNIHSLGYTIQNLMEQVRGLALQNHQLMEQLATDPLINVRKAVAEFNLK